ncbi:MAG: phosphohistidine phosphatase SixA [Deltaproteobacteria bacterium]|jgi:phosphohistidine phosphatase|nr:phosphohistidine phosphatase SixA [Deltaproteobacteria bacterium]MBT6433309.1 phosphohistidine phosphatase SixA [Deltaproteobacteria bacterium]MBT6492082.1 phosphohistidine phosphatase SixA [Deltaproteobacteria bacterium]
MWLYLFRHGIAWDREDPLCPPDIQRPLTAKGIQKTRAAAAGIKRIGPTFNKLWVSPYLRAQQTLEQASDALGFQTLRTEVFDDMVPMGSVTHFLKRVRSTQATGIFCIGHAPHFDDVVQEAICSRNGTLRIKKAGLAILKYEKERFVLHECYTPRILRMIGR